MRPPLRADTFSLHWVAQGLYVLVALIWLIPDRRIERAIGDTEHAHAGNPPPHA